MRNLTDLVNGRPRAAAAVGFGAAGTALAAFWYLPLTIQGRHPVLHSLLFVVLPGLAAAAAGAALGRWLVRPARLSPGGTAALRGAGIATVALLIFAPLFASLFALTGPGPERWNVLGLTALLLEGGALAAWLPSAAIGAGVGWLLYRLGRGDSTRA